MLLQVIAFAKSSEHFLTRPVPPKQSCHAKAPPLPSDPISKNDIEVNNFTIDSGSRLYLNFTWDLPNATYGRVKGYQVRVLYMPVSSKGEPISSANIITDKQFTTVC